MSGLNSTSRPGIYLDVVPPTASRGCGCDFPAMDKPEEEMDSIVHIAIIAAVIVAVALVLVCLLTILLCYVCRHKGTYHTNEAKGAEFVESADMALQNDPALQDAGDHSRKEYFI